MPARQLRVQLVQAMPDDPKYVLLERCEVCYALTLVTDATLHYYQEHDTS